MMNWWFTSLILLLQRLYRCQSSRAIWCAESFESQMNTNPGNCISNGERHGRYTEPCPENFINDRISVNAPFELEYSINGGNLSRYIIYDPLSYFAG